MQPIPWPTRLTVARDRAGLRVEYDDGSHHAMSAELLRVMTPSAERKGHGMRQVIGGKRDVRIKAVDPVGRYAVRIVFDDGHDSGLYTFETLHTLGATGADLFATYEDELSRTGLDRDRPGQAPAPV